MNYYYYKNLWEAKLIKTQVEYTSISPLYQQTTKSDVYVLCVSKYFQVTV